MRKTGAQSTLGGSSPPYEREKIGIQGNIRAQSSAGFGVKAKLAGLWGAWSLMILYFGSGPGSAHQTRRN